MQRLNGLDSTMVYGEALGTPLHMGTLSIFDPSSAPEGLDLARVRELFRQRLAHLPLYRHRLARVPMALDRPVWIEDPDVDVDDHIHGIRLPGPGTDRELGDLVGELSEPPLDLSKPLWEKWVIEGLDGGRVAVLDRLHHAAVDGVRGMEVQAATYDIAADAPLARPGRIPGAGERVPTRPELLTRAALRMAEAPVRTAATAGRLARAATQLAGVISRGEHRGLTMPLAAPPTGFNRMPTERRGFAFGSLSLGGTKKIAHREGVKVNDVVLALTGGALRRYLQERCELPDRSLTAAVPVGIAGEGGGAVAGNRVSVMPASLGTDVADPLERLHAVATTSRAGKALLEAVDPDLMGQVLGVVPPVFIAVVARAYGALRLANLHPPLANVILSNVRGAPMPLYLAGARLLSAHPVGPVSVGLGLNVTLLSYLDALDVGVAVCPDLFEDPWRLVAALHEEAEALGVERRGAGSRR
jgi:diacylglycerol O-acyltransferase / wax synthase